MGRLVLNNTSGGHFLADNYGDCIKHMEVPQISGSTNGHGKHKNVMKKQAIAFLSSVKALSEERWVEIFAEAASFINKKKKHHHSASHASSDIVDANYEDDFIITSDVNWLRYD